ncbi:MAG TPA: TIGR00730 family Rossman fold protein [Verrucomicrobiae bacterium]|nr:TIGR00730 family Rossman fold protein [Verrucomicrobiae bacterium]
MESEIADRFEPHSPKIPSRDANGSPAGEGDRYMLEGPRARTSELVTLFRIMRDFLRGFRVLHFVGPCVTAFGSARTKETSPYYQLARQMGAAITRLGFTVMTGGGPGIMEAANRGAKEAGGRSVGCNIELPQEQGCNAYLDRSVTLKFFFVRKTLLIKYSYAFVVFPGGAGTVDELFEALTLIQTGKIQQFPVVIMGTDYWQEMIAFVEKMARVGTISPNDVKLIYATDSVDEAIDHIRQHAIEPFGLRAVMRRHLRLLGERPGVHSEGPSVRG